MTVDARPRPGILMQTLCRGRVVERGAREGARADRQRTGSKVWAHLSFLLPTPHTPARQPAAHGTSAAHANTTVIPPVPAGPFCLMQAARARARAIGCSLSKRALALRGSWSHLQSLAVSCRAHARGGSGVLHALTSEGVGGPQRGRQAAARAGEKEPRYPCAAACCRASQLSPPLPLALF